MFRKKKNYKTKAADLYQGQLFKKVKKFAKNNNFDLKIISAKYGLINSEKIIEPYDKKIINLNDINKLRKIVLPKFLELIKYYDIILIIMGFKYREIFNRLKKRNIIFVKVDKGLGEYLQLISKLLKYDKIRIINLLENVENGVISLKKVNSSEKLGYKEFNF